MNIGGPPPGGEKGPGGGQRPRGRHIEHACNPCRRRKGRCDGEKPTCLACRIAGTTEACTWDGPDRRRGYASEISALQERVTALEGTLRPLAAILRQFGSIENVINILQNTTTSPAGFRGGHNQCPPSGSTPGAPDSAGNNPISLPNGAPSSHPQHGDGVYLDVPQTWHRQRSVSTSSSDSGFASEASSMASSSSGHGFAASTGGHQNPRLSLSNPGTFAQPSPTLAPAPAPSSGVIASAANNLSTSRFTRQPERQSGGSPNTPVQPGRNHQRTLATPSSGSNFAWASAMAPSSAGQGVAMPVRSPQHPMLGPQYPVFIPTMSNIANQVPVASAPHPTPSPGLPRSAGDYPSWPHFALLPQLGRDGSIYVHVPTDSLGAEGPSMVSSTGPHVNMNDITMTVESPDAPTVREHVSVSTVRSAAPNAAFADEDDLFGGGGNVQLSEIIPYDASTQYPTWNGQA